MRRTITLATVLLAPLLSAAEPDQQTNEKPPYQRLLQGDDARRADDLEQQILGLSRNGKSAEAVPAARDLLALRQRVQGADHWQTADARRLLATLEQTGALPADAQAELATTLKLDDEVKQLAAQHRDAETVPLLQRALELRVRHLGKEHPDVARTAVRLGSVLSRTGKYAEAEAHYRQALTVQRQVLGDDHPETSSTLNDLAVTLNRRGRYPEAETLYRQALAVQRRVLGEENVETARTLSNLGTNLVSRARHAEAESLLRQALALRRRLLGDEHADTLQTLNSLAGCLNGQGKYAAAEPLFRQALDVQRRVLGDEHPSTAVTCNNVAANLHDQGKYAEAEPFYHQALVVIRKVRGDRHPQTAQIYSNVAVNLGAQGKYAEAEDGYRQALTILRQALGDEHPSTAYTVYNLASNLRAQTRYAEAEPLYRQALDVLHRRLGEDHPQTIQCAGGLALTLDHQKRYAEAEPLFRQALAAATRALGETHPQTARDRNNLAGNLYLQHKNAEAETIQRQTLAFFQQTLGEEHPNTVQAWNNLASVLNAQGKTAEAEQAWEAAAAHFAVVRQQAAHTGLERATMGMDHSPLKPLTAALARNGKPAEAWRRLEEGLGRGLFDDLSARQNRRLSATDRQRQQELSARLQRLDKLFAALPPARDDKPGPLAELSRQYGAVQAECAALEAELVRKYGAAVGEVYDLDRIQAQLPADAALLAWLDVAGPPPERDEGGEHWACVVRRQGPPAWVRLPGSGAAGAWIARDSLLPARLGRRLAERPGDADEGTQIMRAALARQRLAPVTPLLAGRDSQPPVKHLIVLTSPWMSTVPVETLLTDTDNYTISYAPSGTLFAWLRGQAAARAKHPLSLLALADPAFATTNASATQEQARGPVFQQLPGTRREVQSLEQVFRSQDAPVALLLGSDASEPRLQQLLAQDRPAPYRFIHLATHGLVDQRRALQSALVLAQNRLPDPVAEALAGKPVYDGKLRAEQILRTWNLDADLVVLSACDSGLGKHVGGEGYLGFAQALFLAGAHSCVLSLWPVDDTATALLMQRFYENLLGKRADGRPGSVSDGSKAEALREAKQWLRNLTSDQVIEQVARLPKLERGGERARTPAAATQARPFAHPYYWSAFILIGDPN
jgi:CHAT domain-containing protein/tetratricopeptide (TPR) repeat protein